MEPCTCTHEPPPPDSVAPFGPRIASPSCPVHAPPPPRRRRPPIALALMVAALAPYSSPVIDSAFAPEPLPPARRRRGWR